MSHVDNKVLDTESYKSNKVLFAFIAVKLLLPMKIAAAAVSKDLFEQLCRFTS